MGKPTPTIKAATWSEDGHHIRSVRYAVFVLELAIPSELDFDGLDPTCAHALVCCGSEAVATGRMQPDGHIGRIAVRKAYRGRGMGRSLVHFFMEMAKQKGLDFVYLNAQMPAAGFYEKLGFRKTGGPFIEAGIEHIRMERASGQTRGAHAGEASPWTQEQALS